MTSNFQGRSRSGSSLQVVTSSNLLKDSAVRRVIYIGISNLLRDSAESLKGFCSDTRDIHRNKLYIHRHDESVEVILSASSTKHRRVCCVAAVRLVIYI